MKDIVFAGSSLAAIRRFPQNVKREAGYQLDKVQHNEESDDWKPMTTIATGVREIRIYDADGVFRVIYIANFEEAVYVLHAFQKKTQKTSRQDLEAAKRAYGQILEDRKS
jgi:phage-related protein